MSNPATVEEALQLHLRGDSAHAARILNNLAEHGNGYAAHELGVLYLTGGADLAVDREAGLKWLQRSVELGFEATIASDPEWFRHST